MARIQSKKSVKSSQSSKSSSAKPVIRPIKGPTLGIAVVGCGNVSTLHLRGWRDAGCPVEIRALVDVCLDNARKRRDEIEIASKARLCADFREVLAAGDIDIIEICSSSDVHTEQIIGSLVAGKHVLTEKPVGYSLEECRQLRWYRQHYPKPKVGVAYSLRYYPVNQQAKRELEAGAIGRPMYATVVHNHYGNMEHFEQPGPGRRGEHVFTDAGGRYVAGSTMTHATHPFDFARWIMGEVEDVFCFQESVGTFATFRHINGTVTQVIGSSAAKGGLQAPVALCVQGTRGTLVTYYVEGKESWEAGVYGGYVVVGGKRREFTPDFRDTAHGDVSRCRNFYSAITADEPLICDMLDAIRTTELLHAIRDSHDHEIRVPIHRTDKTG